MRHWQNTDLNKNRRVRGACPFDSFYVPCIFLVKKINLWDF